MSRANGKNVVYTSTTATARRWGCSVQWVRVLLRRGLVPGARRDVDQLGRVSLLIPADADRPTLTGKPGPKPKTNV